MNLFKYKIISDSIKKQIFFCIKRFKSKKALKREEQGTRVKALKHFDDFYKAVFAEKWPSVRLGLLCKQKHFAVINNFGEVEGTEKFLESQGAFNLRSFLHAHKNFVVRQKENLPSYKSNLGLGEVIKQQVDLEEEKELKLHPEGIEFKLKQDQYSQETNENETDDEYVYKPEDARTSMTSDLKNAEIDTSRLILPNEASCTSLHEFIPSTKLRGVEGFVPESDYYKYYQVKTETLTQTEDEDELEFPENLKVYTFDRGEAVDFLEPRRCINHVYNYLKIDGADLLVALALGVQPQDSVLDLCSTSGEIPFCILQTLRPKYLLCTSDTKGSREKLFCDYLFEKSSLWRDTLFVMKSSMEYCNTDYLFDKVLVDVPSTFDKLCLFEREYSSLFDPFRVKERLQLPQRQCSLLLQGLNLVLPGGTVIYTTSTLSPVQNDGVVNEALKAVQKESKFEFTVKNLTPALEHMSCFFNFGDYLNMKYGKLVVPFAPVNFGPRYICKIVRKS